MKLREGRLPQIQDFPLAAFKVRAARAWLAHGRMEVKVGPRKRRRNGGPLEVAAGATPRWGSSQ